MRSIRSMLARRKSSELRESAASVGGGVVVGKLGNRVEAVEDGSFGRMQDPASGSGGSFRASRRCGVRIADKERAIAQCVVRLQDLLEPGGGKIADISIYGQDSRSVAKTDEVKWARWKRPLGLATRARRVRLRRQQPRQSNATTRRLALINLALRGLEADFGPEHDDIFRRDLHPDLRAATATRVSAKSRPRSHYAGLLSSERQLLANPPFNDSDWLRRKE